MCVQIWIQSVWTTSLKNKQVVRNKFHMGGIICSCPTGFLEFWIRNLMESSVTGVGKVLPTHLYSPLQPSLKTVQDKTTGIIFLSSHLLTPVLYSLSLLLFLFSFLPIPLLLPPLHSPSLFLLLFLPLFFFLLLLLLFLSYCSRLFKIAFSILGIFAQQL